MAGASADGGIVVIEEINSGGNSGGLAANASGEIIGIPQSTVKTRMFYARKQLADLLKGAGVESLAA